jgi:hypothetical protein
MKHMRGLGFIRRLKGSWQRGAEDRRENDCYQDTDEKFNSNQSLAINNNEIELLEIMIEVWPNRYVLQPNEKMIIEGDIDGLLIDIIPYHLGLQIYFGNCFDPKVTIDGIIVEPDWETSTPNSK